MTWSKIDGLAKADINKNLQKRNHRLFIANTRHDDVSLRPIYERDKVNLC